MTGSAWLDINSISPTPQATPEPPKAASLFDAPAAVPNSDMDEEEEILAESGEEDEVSEEIDEAA